VHELAALITQLTDTPLPLEPRTTLNAGTMRGGTGVNVLAAEVVCELDLRSENAPTLKELAEQIEVLVRNANREGVNVSAELIGQRPSGEMNADHPIIKLGLDCLREQGLEPELSSGSTDANIPLSSGLPALVLGVTTGGSAHTINEFIDIEPIEKGMEQLVNFVGRVQ
jgi:tripeptide aminopeptidase